MNSKIDLPLSPRSSSGEAKSTPDARLTAPASEDCSDGQSTLLQKLAGPTSLTPPAKSRATHSQDLGVNERDPFVTPGHSSKTRLSPTASAFSPWSGGNSHQQDNSPRPISAAFSKEMGLSRTISISSNQHLSASDIYRWLQVINTFSLLAT